MPRYASVKCLALLSLMLATAAAQPSYNYEKNYNAARQSLAQGHFMEAERSMRAALAEAENAPAGDSRLPVAL